MKDQAHKTPDLKSGIAATYTAERERVKKILDKLEIFNEQLAIEKMMAQDAGLQFAIVEAPLDVIEHFNRGKLINAFHAVGYFLYQGAAVCLEGTKEQVENNLELSHQQTPDDWNKDHPQAQVQRVAKFKRQTAPPA